MPALKSLHSQFGLRGLLGAVVLAACASGFYARNVNWKYMAIERMSGPGVAVEINFERGSEPSLLSQILGRKYRDAEVNVFVFPAANQPPLEWIVEQLNAAPDDAFIRLVLMHSRPQQEIIGALSGSRRIDSAWIKESCEPIDLDHIRAALPIADLSTYNDAPKFR